MLARVQSYLLDGIDALPCEVEVDHGDSDIREKGPMVVGLADTAVKESIERVRSALLNCGYQFPDGRVLINLAPADVRKEGPAYDLPMAIGLLMVQGVIRDEATPRISVRSAKHTQRAPSASTGALPNNENANGQADAAAPDHDFLTQLDAIEPEPLDPRRYLIAGELALDGRLRPIKGVIAMAALAASKGYHGVIVPKDNAAEAAVVPGIEALGASTLVEVVGLLTGRLQPSSHPTTDVAALLTTAQAEIDFADVRGQEAVKRALVIAAAGGHNLLMLGPAGTGKSMMAKAFPGILPPMTPDEAIEVTRIYSAAGVLPTGVGLVTTRPVRCPHHTASGAAVIGGGMIPKPGEVSLAHRGVLFLDELAEFPRYVLETMRQPLEDHIVSIARSHSSVRFPASFQLLAAMNPTPKGDMPVSDVGKRAMDRYLSKLSGPLIDRIDLHVEAPAVPWNQLSASSGPKGTSSAQMREKVLNARAVAEKRQGPGIPNARLSGRKLDTLAPMNEQARAMLGHALTELGLSARAYDKIRRVARTIADLDGVADIQTQHVSEAIGYRLLDRKV